jgi:protein transport protein SEC24
MAYYQGGGYAQPGPDGHGQDGDDLAHQMGQMGLNGPPAHGAHKKKKDRHAYHQIEQPAQQPQFMNGQGAPQPWQPAQIPQGMSASPQPAWQAPQQPWQSPQVGQGAYPSPAGTPIAMGQMSAGQGVAVGGMAMQGKVNPEQIPSVPLSRDLPAEYYKTRIYPTMERRLPPPATTPFVAFDQGNASPKHARLSMNVIPTSHEQLMSTGLPLGLVLQPLAKQTDGEQAIPVLDFGEQGPPRCRRCRAYINPFMIFSNGGNRMTCNLCGHPNEVPPDYFAPTDPTGVRVDRMQRPELLLGTCEFLVPKEYWSKEPVPMRFLFLIDASHEAYSRGFLQGICDGILTALYGDDGQETTDGETNGDAGLKPSKVPAGAKVGFMTFDRTIHFYNVSSAVSAPQQLVVSDLEDPFAPISGKHLFVDAAESRSNITKLLKQIPQMFATQPTPDTTLLPSLHAALSALETSGGKIICSLSTLPTWGPQSTRLHPRDKSQQHHDDGEHAKEILKAEHQLFKKCQAEMVKAGVGVDFFLSAPSGGYLDVATVGYISEKTGGECYYYPNWTWPRDCLRLEKELAHTIQREQGYASLMKVRCSNGLQIAHYSGNFTQHTFGADLELASVTSDSAMTVTFAYDGKVSLRINPVASVEERRRATHHEVRLHMPSIYLNQNRALQLTTFLHSSTQNWMPTFKLLYSTPRLQASAAYAASTSSPPSPKPPEKA